MNNLNHIYYVGLVNSDEIILEYSEPQSLKYKANAEGGKEWKIYFIVAVPPWTQQLNTKNDRMTRRGLNFTVAANKVDLSLAERRSEKENDNFYCVAKKSE